MYITFCEIASPSTSTLGASRVKAEIKRPSIISFASILHITTEKTGNYFLLIVKVILQERKYQTKNIDTYLTIHLN